MTAQADDKLKTLQAKGAKKIGFNALFADRAEYVDVDGSAKPADERGVAKVQNLNVGNQKKAQVLMR